jgi:predicted PilT family ATPase
MSDTADGSEGTGNDFMSTYGTHVVAVGVGVLVTLLVVGKLHGGGGRRGGGNEAVTTASTAKKKKKNKKKTIATGAAVRGVPPENDASAKTQAVPKTEAASTAAKTEASATPAPVQETELEPVVSKGKKKKKKKKNGNAVNGNSNNNNSDEKSSTQNGASSTVSNRTPAMEAPPPAPASFYDYDPRLIRQEEEVWETIPNNKSKNKKAVVAKAVATPSASAAKAATTKVTETVVIDAAKVGIVIGPKGATMQAIQAATGCRLDINAPAKDDKPNPRSTKSQKATVVITAADNATVTTEQIKKARQAVLELASRGYATLLQAETFGEQAVSVHPRCLAEIVGPGGSNIQAIQNTLQVKITIPKTEWTPNTPQIGNQKPSCKVGIAGDDKQNVKKAKQTIADLLKYHHTEVTHPGMIHEEVYVPQEFVHCVVGKRGSEIKHIKGNYKVQVYMADSENENCIVVGKRTNVDKAVSYIQLLMERDAEQRAHKYSDEYYG